MIRTLLAVFSLGLLSFTTGCAQWADAAASASQSTKAICVLRPTAGNKVSGVVRFTKVGNEVRIQAEVTGLTPGLHGFHVHEFGDVNCTNGKCTGGHFNPEGKKHGKPTDAERHVGDLGNLRADAKGKATYDRTDSVISFTGSHSIVGRGIVVHAKPDNFGQPTGNAGARVAVGVIGLAKPN